MATVQNDVLNLLLKDLIHHFRPWPREIIPTATNLRGRGLTPASLHSSPSDHHHLSPNDDVVARARQVWTRMQCQQVPSTCDKAAGTAHWREDSGEIFS